MATLSPDPPEVRSGLKRANKHARQRINMPVGRALNSRNAGRLPGLEPRETQVGSGPGGHEGGENIVRVAVQVLAGPVVSHGRARIGVAGGDLDVAQVDSGVEHGRDIWYDGAYEGVPW